MKILVLGGSYFYGRVFTMLNGKKHDITVVNRGTYSMEEFGVRQIKGDRRDEEVLRQLSDQGTVFEAVVDFCGYEPGDVAAVVKHLSGKTKQYIFISTVDVYERGGGGIKNEDTPYETRSIEGEAGAYIRGKAALEAELREVCFQKEMAYTILRPAVLYGPYNYAPRESLFIRMALQNRFLPEITDGTGKFQFTYVKDAALAIEKCLLNEKTYGQAYNLCGDEVLDYRLFMESLERAIKEDIDAIPGKSKDSAEAGEDSVRPGEGFVKTEEGARIIYGTGTERLTENSGKQYIRRVSMTAEEAAAQGIPLPFPVYEAETELYSNEKSKKELGMTYTPFQEGIGKTYRAFKGVFV